MGGKRVLERFNRYKLGWLRDSLFFIAVIAVVFVVFRFIIGLSVVGGDSMDPTLKDGNVVLYLRVGGDYRQGDIVSMRVPSGEYYIKRVVAVGGEVVDIYDGAFMWMARPETMTMPEGRPVRSPAQLSIRIW